MSLKVLFPIIFLLIISVNPVYGGEIALTSGLVYDMNPLWSPEGSAIAFTRKTDTNGNGKIDFWEDENSIWTMNADGSELHQVFGPDKDVGLLEWSPQSDKLLIAGGKFFAVIDLEGRTLRKIVNSRRITYLNPTWSPDEEYLLFAIRRSDKISLWKMETASFLESTAQYISNSEEYEVLLEGLSEYSIFPRWSPDGRYIAFTLGEGIAGVNSLWVMNADGSEKREVLPTNIEKLEVDNGILSDQLSWSPEEAIVAVVTQGAGMHGIVLIDVEFNDLEVFTEIENYFEPIFSPDNEYLAYVDIKVESKEGKVEQKSEIWYLDQDKSRYRVSSGFGSDSNPAWSPDSTKLAFAKEYEGTSHIYISDIVNED